MKLASATSSWAMLAITFAILSLVMPLGALPEGGEGSYAVAHIWRSAACSLTLIAALATMHVSNNALWKYLVVALTAAGACAVLGLAPATGNEAPRAGFWLLVAAELVLACLTVRAWAHREGRLAGIATILLFGLWILYFWQVFVAALQIPKILLPTPALIAQSFVTGLGTLAQDFVQTVVKSVLTGWLLGSTLGFLVGVAIDRVPFLQRGLLPLAALTSAVPLVAVAPIAVMWFGFDWPSKAAVVVLMTFFPMLVATRAGLRAAGRQELELMYSYACGYLRTLIDLRLPCATPYLFGALKVNAALALIGAIVAEFFGSPTAGLGFRISTEAAHMNMSLVWAAIVVAAATGSLTYALLTQLERRMAFWHPSVRQL